MELRKAEDEIFSLEETYKRLCKIELQEEIDDIQSLIHLNSDVSPVAMQNKEKTGIKVSAADFLNDLVDLRAKMENVKPIVEKCRMRLTMNDPVTNAPRYGKKTIERVERIMEKYEHLQTVVNDAFGEIETSTKVTIVQRLKNYVQNEKEKKHRQKEIDKAKKMELSREIKEKEKEEETKKQRAQEEEILRQKQERETLRLQAEKARSRRIESEQRALEIEQEADRAFISSVDVGPDGVRNQLQQLRNNCNLDELRIALKALRTIFSQIASRPEEIQFRRIRLDHPKFEEDIGRHHGGKELLIAGGFIFQEIDGTKCLFTAEPDLETDMDAWSSWYQLIKDTLNILDEELLK